jgi:hypothetical protein
MSTHRERRERKAERLREWADGREAKAQAAHETAREVGGMIPLGQPILVGHHSEKRHRRDIERIDNAMRASVESADKADAMRSRAENIEAQNARAIYDDDADALERLQEKLAGLERKREAMKAANAEYRKAHRADLKAVSAYERGQAVPFPSYAISNIGGVITTTRQRIERLSKPEHGRRLVARYAGRCRKCEGDVAAGAIVRYFRRTREVEHVDCPEVTTCP